MIFRKIPSRIELTFWQIVINLLSQSLLIQRMFRWIYFVFFPIIKSFPKQIDIKRLFRWSATGLGIGIITGFVISLL